MAGWLAARLGVKVQAGRRARRRRAWCRCAWSAARGPVELIRPDGQAPARCASPASRTGSSRWPGAPCRTASPRSCAGWTPTRSTARRWPGSGRSRAAGRRPPSRQRAGRDVRRVERRRRRSSSGGRRPGMSRRDIVVHAHPDVLAAAAAARLVTRLVDVQAAGQRAPAGAHRRRRSGSRCSSTWRRATARTTPSTGRTSSSTGATSGSCRPATPSATRPGARQALLDHLPVDPARVHPMGADTGTGPSGAEAAAQAYAELLAGHGPPGGPRARAHLRRHRCSAWAARGTRRRSSRTPPPSTRPSAPSSRCTAAPSRRRRACR